MRLLTLTFLFSTLGAAEDGLQGWLRYAAVPGAQNATIPSQIVALNATEGSPISTAQLELEKGIESITGKAIKRRSRARQQSRAIILGTRDAFVKHYGNITALSGLEEDGFYLNTEGADVTIVGHNERGTLYGAFEYLTRLAQGNFAPTSAVHNPQAPIRWTNEWDNLDGSIERGYAGPSNFFRNGFVVENVTRTAEYARLLASLRINGVIINNVNANASLLYDRNLDGIGRLADAMRPYGVQLGIALNFASPQTFGGLPSFDPSDPKVDAWWVNITNVLYEKVPDMAGYLVKANSEGQPGPLTYNRTLAEGGNMFAKAVKPHGGVVMFRAFVYDHHISPTNWTSDRANGALEAFQDLDGKFDDNVVVQIKYGPLDFQVREPPSPLFSFLRDESTAIELQVTPEYQGQNDHLVYLAPLWKEILEFDMRADSQPSKVKDIVSGQRFKRKLGGYAGVVGAGANTTWLGSHLAMSNLYAYGRLAWDASLDPQDVLQDWIRLTFGCDEQVVSTITDMAMRSLPAYENYSGNLGVGTLTDVLYTHFGPNPLNTDNNGWGFWQRADHDTIGMDRTVKNGTGNTGQYAPEVAQMFENIETTPDNLLLWFHHVPYTQKLKSGKTVIQHFYDAHYEGAATAQEFVTQWESLEGKIDQERYENVLYEQKFQAGHALVWRDAINNFYHNVSGIPDDNRRVGNHPYRIEAEKMTLSGYKTYAVKPFIAASGSAAIVTTSNSTTGTAMTNVTFASGTYDVAVNYFDLIRGKAKYHLAVGNQTVGEWVGDAEDKLGHEPSLYLDAHSAMRITFKGVSVAHGDLVRITGQADGMEPAPLDYISFLPPGVVD